MVNGAETGKFRPPIRLLSPISNASIVVAHLDERIARSPFRQGWIERSHFTDTCASLWVDGGLVHQGNGLTMVTAKTICRASTMLRSMRRWRDRQPRSRTQPGLAGAEVALHPKKIR